MSPADAGFSDPAACPAVPCRRSPSPRTAAVLSYASNGHSVQWRTSPLSEAGATFRPQVSATCADREET